MVERSWADPHLRPRERLTPLQRSASSRSPSYSPQAIPTPNSSASEGRSDLYARRNPTRLFETCFALPTSRVVANSSPRQTHERRVLQGRVFRFLRRDFEGWARAGGRRVSLSLNRRVARTPPLADRMGRKSLRVSPREGAGLRLGRSRWSGHYPRVRERWFGPDRLRTVTRGLCLRTSQRVCFAASGSE